MDPFETPVTAEGRSASLPQLQDGLFLTDSGLETTLIYRHHLDLPAFAAFVLLETNAGRQRLRAYFERHAAIARTHGAGFIAESPTWRANPDWGARSATTQSAWRRSTAPRSCSWPSYAPAPGRARTRISSAAASGHATTATTPPCAWERPMPSATTKRRSRRSPTPRSTSSRRSRSPTSTRPWGSRVPRSAPACRSVISFTVETDGRLPSGTTIEDAILQVDAATDRGPAYYMINCAHPSHFSAALQAGRRWPLRLRGIRANASRRSHAELDAATTLDDGDPVELAVEYRRLVMALPQLSILGGCCGTDHRHVSAIAEVCADLFEPIRAARSG